MVTNMPSGRLSKVRRPGPRALHHDEPLLGRDKEMTRLLTAVRAPYHVIQITGWTGVGKSSFLNRARRRLIEDDERTIVPGNETWTGWPIILGRVQPAPNVRAAELARQIYTAAIGGEQG